MIKEEFKNIGRHKLLIATISAIMFIPFLYAVFFLKSVWDPYGNAGKLPVAIVNEDRAVDYRGKTMTVGDDLVKKLRKNDSLQWHFVSAAKAQEGLKDKKYYTIITIPKDFSENATTVLNKNPKKMHLIYKTNDSLNYIGKVISEEGAKQLNTKVRSSVTDVYAKTMFATIKTVGKGFTTAAKGANKLSNGSATLSDGFNTYTAGVEKVNNGVMTLQTGVVPLGRGVLKLTTGATVLEDGINQYTAGVAKVNAGTQKLNGSTGQLASGVTKLASGSNSLAAGVNTYTAGVNKVNNGVQTLNGSTGQLAVGVGQLAKGSTNLNSGVGQYTTGVAKVNRGLGELNNQTGTLATGVDQLSAGSAKLTSGIQTYTTGVTSLNSGLGQLASKSEQLNSGAAGLKQLPQAAAALYVTNSVIARSLQEIKAGLQNTDELTGALGMLQNLATFYNQYGSTLTNMTTLTTSLQTVNTSLQKIAQNSQTIEQNAQTLQASKNLDENDKQKLQAILSANETNLNQLQELQKAGISSTQITAINNALNSFQGIMKNASLTQDKLSQLNSASTNLKKLSTSIDELNTMATKTQGIAATLNQNLGNTNNVDVDGIINAGTGAQTQVAGAVVSNTNTSKIDQLIAGINEYTAGVDQAAAGSAELAQNSTTLTQGSTSLSSNLSGLNDKVPALTSGVAQLFDGSNKLTANSAALVNGTAQLAGGLGTLNSKVPVLTSGVAQLAGGTSQLAANSGTLNNGVTQLAGGLGVLNGKVPALTNGVAQLANGTQQLDNNGSKLSNGAAQLADGTQQLNAKVPTLTSGVDQLAGGTQQLAANSGKLTAGVKKLHQGNQQLAGGLSDGAAKIAAGKTSAKTADMFAAPSNLKHENYSKVPNYGYALAPYMLSVALYVGALVFNLVYPIRRLSTPDGSGTDWFLSKVAVGTLVAVGTALVETILMMSLGLVPDHPLQLILNAIFFSMTAMYLIMLMSVAGGNPGRFAAMILLVIQLGGSGGSFPIEITNGMNGFFQAVNPFLPMTYSILGFREALTSGLGISQFITSLAVMLLFIIVSLGLLWLTMVHLRRSGAITYVETVEGKDAAKQA
ncbi:YhgE/Pip domain-containing protein [Liquorilactobacillus capillatus]|nr:YhgE/Pip domain-containing protein [Liquorilactobacillus capillatus]